MQETLYVGRGSLGKERYLSPTFWSREIAKDLRLLVSSRHVLANLVKTQLITRYHRSSLGFLWTLLNPLLLLSVQAAVFSQVLGMDFRGFVVYLFAGLIAWQFFAGAIDGGSKSLIIHEGLLRKVAIPKFLCLLAEVIGGCVNLLFATAAISVLLFAIERFVPAGAAPQAKSLTSVVGNGLAFHPQLVIFPVAVLLLTGFLVGLGLIGMTIVTWFRDFEHMLGIFLNALYFTIPIAYPPDVIKNPTALSLLKLNPVYHYIALFQHSIALGTWPAMETWYWAVGSCVAFLVVGYCTYKVYEDDYIFRL